MTAKQFGADDARGSVARVMVLVTACILLSWLHRWLAGQHNNNKQQRQEQLRRQLELLARQPGPPPDCGAACGASWSGEEGVTGGWAEMRLGGREVVGVGGAEAELLQQEVGSLRAVLELRAAEVRQLRRELDRAAVRAATSLAERSTQTVGQEQLGMKSSDPI